MKKLLLIGLTFFAINLQSQNKIQSSVQEQYENGTWINDYGINYQYDANNNLITKTYYYWDDFNWAESAKFSYTYNVNNMVLTQIIQFVTATPGNFDDYSKTTYTYNGAGKLITIVDQSSDAGIWVNTSKSDITYNGNLIATVTSPTWNGSQWVTDQKGTPTYTGTNLTQIVTEQWDGLNWVNDSRNVMTYNASNKIINNRNEIWDGIWTEDENKSYVLATNGNRTSLIYSIDQEIEYKEDFFYDTTALMSSYAHPFKDKTGLDYISESFPHINKILNFTTSLYNSSTASYSLDSKTTYNYQSQLPLGIENFEISKITLYPNPGNSILNIKVNQHINKVNVIDLAGRTTTINALSNNSFDVSALAKGVYLIEVVVEESVFREKFIKN